jgi:aspartyl-tRNA(Asn)/glutamyl-tRNA(Gln) amidotransferase subunit C
MAQTQHVSERDVRDIAEYTRIRLDDDEVAQMATDLNEIIDSLKPITEYDLEGVEPTFHPIGGLSNVMREDAEGTSFTQAEALANAPKQQDGCFLIPSILGEGGDR